MAQIFGITMRLIRHLPWEALIWCGGLLFLALYPPNDSSHFTLCPIRNLGFDFCPGCGLGRSISYVFHGQLLQSISAHPMGIFAVIVLSFRIFQLLQSYLKAYGKSY